MAKEKAFVIATGGPVPREESPRRYIAADAPVEIEMSNYYRRRLGDGELKKVDAPAASAPSSPVQSDAGKGK